MNECKNKLKNGIFAIGVVVTLSVSTILTPVWIDSINIKNGTLTNRSNVTYDQFKHVNSYSVIFIVNSIYLVLSAIVLGIFILLNLNNDSIKEIKSFKVDFLFIGFADAISTVCLVYASSGSRTAPYLQSLTSNLLIPVTFIVRFTILRKKPTIRKFCCAALVLLAEFIALIPSIFPSLEGKTAHSDDGGASHIAGVLWPLCYAFGFIPQAIVAVMIEKTTKDKVKNPVTENNIVHIVSLMFWSYFFCFAGLCSLFWTDLIPGFGEAESLEDFWNLFSFNILCFLGVDNCDIQAHICSVALIIDMFLTRILIICFLKISEGSNYLVIIMSLQTPLVLLFWTLFSEDPFHFSPHHDLSTWLSLVAVSIMLPSIYVYSTGKPENCDREQIEENKPLLDQREDVRDHQLIFNKSSDSYQSIDVQVATSEEENYYRPYAQSFTDSYQSIQSLDSSVNSFRNSYVFRHNSL